VAQWFSLNAVVAIETPLAFLRPTESGPRPGSAPRECNRWERIAQKRERIITARELLGHDTITTLARSPPSFSSFYVFILVARFNQFERI
jgi:hypothetical protein